MTTSLPDDFLRDYTRPVGEDPPPPGQLAAWKGSYALRPSRDSDPGIRGINGTHAHGQPWALGGSIITPERALSHGYVVIERDRIAGVVDKPPHVSNVVETEGVIIPGLIDLHGHPDYNIFPAWEPPHTYENRYRWRESYSYQRVVKVPQNYLKFLQEHDVLPSGIQLRYAEIRALVGGVTAIQGANYDESNERLEPLVRNVDRWIFGAHRARSMIDLPRSTDPADEDVALLNGWLRDIESGSVDALYLHLCEGKRGEPESANEFQRFLELGADTPNTVIIHGCALDAEQIRHVADRRCKLVWSPQSNLRLYNDTTLIEEAFKREMPVALGADWLPSGSTSLLAELKVARRVLAQRDNHAISSRDLVRMVTCNAAQIAGLGDQLGALQSGFAADLVVLERRHQDQYDNVVEADPSWVEMVVIGGDICYIRADLMPLRPPDAEIVNAWGKAMVLDTAYSPIEHEKPNLTLAEARTKLTKYFPQVGPIFA